MKKIAIATDSNAGIRQAEAKDLGVFVLAMPFYIEKKEYFEDISLTQEQFYEKLAQDIDISTSQPTPGHVMDFWQQILNLGFDEIVYLPMSSGLSSSCESAEMLALNFDGKVQVVDNQRISLTLQQSILDALTLAKAGYDAKAIKERLEETKHDQTIYISLETLYYLKKGGRITPAAATLGTMLNLKPVLQIQGGKLDSYAKAHGMKQARLTMIKAIQHDLDTRFKEWDRNGDTQLGISYSGVDMTGPNDWKEQVQKAFPGRSIYMAPLSLSISCHIGPGALAITETRILRP